jgi:hypothetical protein
MENITHPNCKYLTMKSICILILILLSVSTTFCQAPNGFNYQAVLRNASGEVRANTDIIVDVSILQGSTSGDIVYNETQNTTTSSTGLINIVIGSIDTAEFNTINWAAGPYFIQITVDGSLMGTCQLLSVPYAKYASMAANINAGGINTGILNPERFSAYDDLEEENKLNNDNAKDLLTRAQSDARYIPNLSFFARNNVNDDYTFGTQKVEFDNLISGTELLYIKTDDRYYAFYDGVYNFSTTVALTNVAADETLILKCYVNGVAFCNLAALNMNGTHVALSGSTSIQLNSGDYVEIWIYSSDANFTVVGEDLYNRTFFSGHLVNRIF